MQRVPSPLFDAPATLEDLAGRFAVFRRRNKRFTRVPGELRAAVVNAMRHGVTPTQLRRACGLSTSQLELWRASENAPATSRANDVSARVFSVTDEVAPRLGDSPSCTVGDGLELRIGPWSVRVQLVEPQRSELA